MPKSKNRKQHKQKVEKFHKRIQQSRNNINKMNQKIHSQMMEYYQQHYKEYMLEVAYKETPELLVKQENGYLLNDEKVVFEDGVLVWKESKVPVMSSVSLQTSNAGESIPVNPAEYTEEIVYTLLKRMFDRHQQAEASEVQLVPEAEVLDIVEPAT